MDELEHFRAFSTWLRLEIDKQASPTANEELTEKEATMQNAKVLTYIQRYLVSSPLASYLEEAKREDYAKDEEVADTGPPLLDTLDEQIKRHESDQQYTKGLLHVKFLLSYLENRAGTVFQGIAEAKRRSVRFGRATELSLGQEIWKHDLHLWTGRKNVSREKKNRPIQVATEQPFI